MSDGNCAFVLASRRGQDSGLHVQGCEHNHPTSVYRAPTMCQAPGQMQRVLLPLGPFTRLLQTAALRGERSNWRCSLTRIHSATKSNRAGTQRDLVGRKLPRTPCPLSSHLSPLLAPRQRGLAPRPYSCVAAPAFAKELTRAWPAAPFACEGQTWPGSPRPSSLPPSVPCDYLWQAHYTPRG